MHLRSLSSLSRAASRSQPRLPLPVGSWTLRWCVLLCDGSRGARGVELLDLACRWPFRRVAPCTVLHGSLSALRNHAHYVCLRAMPGSSTP